jgi:hypothetical protein
VEVVRLALALVVVVAVVLTEDAGDSISLGVLGGGGGMKREGRSELDRLIKALKLENAVEVMEAEAEEEEEEEEVEDVGGFDMDLDLGEVIINSLLFSFPSTTPFTCFKFLEVVEVEEEEDDDVFEEVLILECVEFDQLDSA